MKLIIIWVQNEIRLYIVTRLKASLYKTTFYNFYQDA